MLIASNILAERVMRFSVLLGSTTGTPRMHWLQTGRGRASSLAPSATLIFQACDIPRSSRIAAGDALQTIAEAA